MSSRARMELDENVLELINGGSMGFNPDGFDENGNQLYEMVGEFTKQRFKGITFMQIIDIAQYAGHISNDIDGELKIIAYAKSKNYI